ncbi:heme biosynthesis protein HemY [Candidatus Liberibacter americanus]|uniref:HemY N-terminal domain-containing protein n=1 Tax=Candidatus Liberibacter americanus str. Sao Paulo TaxID=1261131 RepID=U6B4Y2_9HYPH|nr:heme biosynthesis HemY N-terminal domain-containing protein [Candidatus Liberibacter americanus]AHA28129.1 hypothetical protein lam_786 [Candidatus Liberibacter americanus str. Sao Paulo]EMS36024.1 HemY domain-containing protein [Candidatus Liberibacter americanus PW_SP]
MLRITYYFCIIFIVISSLITASYYSKDISIILGNQVYQTSSIVALSFVYVLLFALTFILAILRFFFDCPHAIVRVFNKHNYNKGYNDLSTGLIALAAKNKVLARKIASNISSKINPTTEPLVLLLESQLAIADHQHLVALEKFEMMLKIPATKEFALYGLYNESCRIGDLKSAKYYAEEAIKKSTNLEWCIDAVLQHYVHEKDWSNAINFLNQQKKSNCIKDYNRKKSILLIARSLENLSIDNATSAYNDAMEALKICNDSIVAAISAAKALIIQNKINKAEKVLEQIWKINTHPEIANIYITLSSKNSSDKIKRALKLESINKNNVESLIAVAKTLLKEGNINQARKKAMYAAEKYPRKGIFLLLAEIEKSFPENINSVIYWTEKAINAIPDPIWIAEDGSLSEEWIPVSPVSGKICIFSWNIITKNNEYIYHKHQTSFFRQNIPENNLNLSKQNKKIPKESKVFINYHSNNRHQENNLLRQPDDPGVDKKHSNIV